MSAELLPLVLLSLAGGLAAGGLGGLLGLGGGIVLLPLLRFGFGLSPAQAAGTCILAVFFTTLGGAWRHHRLGTVELRSLWPLILAGVAGSAIFSLLFVRLAERGRWLDLGIGLVFSLISLRMLVEAARPRRRQAPVPEPRRVGIEGPLGHKLTLGAAAGVLPGLLGIGTGGILVPAFAFLFSAPMKVAAAASLTCFCCNAAVSSGFKLAQGFVEPTVAVPACLGTFIGANLGATVSRGVPSRGLMLLFGLLFTVVSGRFLWAGLG